MKKSNKLIIMLLCLTFLFTLTACGEKEEKKSNNDGVYARVEKVNIEIKDYGTISLDLYPSVAPLTVKNFIDLVNSGFYDGLTFHRIIDGFVIQGGGYDEKGDRRAADTIKGEFAANGVENNIKHERGVISMARATAYDSASSEFFIMQSLN